VDTGLETVCKMGPTTTHRVGDATEGRATHSPGKVTGCRGEGYTPTQPPKQKKKMIEPMRVPGRKKKSQAPPPWDASKPLGKPEGTEGGERHHEFSGGETRRK